MTFTIDPTEVVAQGAPGSDPGTLVIHLPGGASLGVRDEISARLATRVLTALARRGVRMLSFSGALREALGVLASCHIRGRL